MDLETIVKIKNESTVLAIAAMVLILVANLSILNFDICNKWVPWFLSDHLWDITDFLRLTIISMYQGFGDIYFSIKATEIESIIDVLTELSYRL